MKTKFLHSSKVLEILNMDNMLKRKTRKHVLTVFVFSLTDNFIKSGPIGNLKRDLTDAFPESENTHVKHDVPTRRFVLYRLHDKPGRRDYRKEDDPWFDSFCQDLDTVLSLASKYLVLRTRSFSVINTDNQIQNMRDAKLRAHLGKMAEFTSTIKFGRINFEELKVGVLD